MILDFKTRKRLGKGATILDDAGPAPAGPARPALTAEQRRAFAKATRADIAPLMQRMRFDHEQFNALTFLVSRPPLTEYEIVQRALHLADLKATIIQKAEAMLNFAGGRLLSHDTDPAAAAQATAEHGQQGIENWWHSIAEEREMFTQAVLEVERTNAPGDRPRYRRPQRKPVMQKYTPWITESLEDIVVVPRLVWEVPHSRTELRYYALSTKAACGFAFMLLLDDRRALKDLLRLCRPDAGGCGRPFLASIRRSGSAPSVYCSDDCRSNAKRELTKARVARLRARRAKEEAA